MKSSSVKQQSVVFVGGQTAGPVMPLLAVAAEWKRTNPEIRPVFLDIRRSVAARAVPQFGFEFRIITGGKFRRYWTIKNLLAPILIGLGLIRALFLLSSLRPIAVIGAGGYIQVPVMLAAWVLRIPRLIHQQDIVPTLSNKLCAPLANKITTTFELSVKDFSQGLGFTKNYSQYTKVEWTGNPSHIKPPEHPQEERNAALKTFKLDPEWPTVLVMGGGSGAAGLNQVLVHNLPELLKIVQVIHSTGVGKRINPAVDIAHGHDRYHQFEYINQIDKAYAAADIVIARGGMYTITALSVLGKLEVIVPLPDSHQEWNAQYLYERNAAIVLDQRDITSDTFAKVVRKLLFDAKLQKELRQNIHSIMPPNGTTNMLSVIKKMIHG